MNEKEVGRQIIHATGIILVYFLFVLGRDLTLIISSLTAAFLFLISFYAGIRREIKKKIPFRVKVLEQIEDAFFDAVDSLERKSIFPYFGAFTFYLSSTIVMFFFPLKIAMVAIAVLAMQDSFSTLIGAHFGKHKIFYSKIKSWEGTFAGFLAAFLVCLILTDPFRAFTASLVGSLVETLPVKLDDNISIPIAVAIILSVL